MRMKAETIFRQQFTRLPETLLGSPVGQVVIQDMNERKWWSARFPNALIHLSFMNYLDAPDIFYSGQACCLL